MNLLFTNLGLPNNPVPRRHAVDLPALLHGGLWLRRVDLISFRQKRFKVHFHLPLVRRCSAVELSAGLLQSAQGVLGIQRPRMKLAGMRPFFFFLIAQRKTGRSLLFVASASASSDPGPNGVSAEGSPA